MLVNQIAVYLENQPGRLDALVNCISNAGINLECLNIADTENYGIVRIITNNNNLALRTIKEAGFTAKSSDLVAVEVSNVPGQLAKVLDILSKSNISLEYVYSFTKANDVNLILLKTSDTEKTQELLK